MNNPFVFKTPTQAIIDPNQLFASLLESARQLVPFDYGTLALFDAERGVLVAVYENDHQESQRVPEAPPVLAIGQGVVGYVAQTRQSLYVPDVLQEPRYIMGYQDTRSELAVPILLEDQLLGVFNIESRTPYAYQESHQKVLQALAYQSALVIETTRLYGNLRDKYDELENAHSEMAMRNDISRIASSDSPLEERIPRMAYTMMRLAQAEACLITLWDFQTNQPHLMGESYLKTPNNSQVFQRAAARLSKTLYDTEQEILWNVRLDGSLATLEDIPIQSVLALPLIARQRMIGAVLLFRLIEADPFQHQDIDRLQVSLDQIALGIDNRQLLLKTQAHLDESQALLKMAEIAARSMNLDEMMQQVFELTRKLLHIQAGAILHFNRHINELVPLPLGFGFPDNFYHTQFSINLFNSLFAQVFTLGHPKFANDIATLNGTEHTLAIQACFSNLLIVPLRVQDDPLGLFVVANRPTGFSMDEANLLMAMGSHIASAMRNLEYIERLRLYRGLSQVVQRVSAELASEQVLIAACQSIVEAIEGVDHAGIVLNDMPSKSALVVAEYPLRGGIGQKLRLEGYLVYEEMLQTLSPVVVNDLERSEDYLGPNYRLLQNLGIKSLMVVPLIVQNEFIGSIGVDATEKVHHFTTAEIDVMSAIAAQIAISIRNADLFGQLEARTHELVEADRLKSEFLAKMSHELRTPMNSILGFSETLLSGLYGDLNDKQQNRITRIQRSGQNLLSLIDDLLDLSKIEAGRMELRFQSVNLIDEIQTCIMSAESLIQSKRLQLYLIKPDTIPLVLGDNLRIRQVINNLLGNAIKFTKQGTITIKVEIQSRVDENQETYQEIWVSVIDSGIGIRQEDFDIIFDEFRQADGSTTREFGGTGLGLAISRRLIQMMDGRIWVESSLGKGSTFTFALPALEK